MTSHIFVYGSLTTALAHPMGDRLRREATLIGAAAVQGRLYRVSWYPGLKTSDDERDVVHGEVYRLTDPVASLAWLDEYEGIARGALSAGAADEYIRAKTMARIASGEVLPVWVYWYQWSLDETARVLDGVWRG
jgi:gamma-glutamylcyclotransferase (GGCT)/AIG2-like uncharacterized protein YtfP